MNLVTKKNNTHKIADIGIEQIAKAITVTCFCHIIYNCFCIFSVTVITQLFYSLL